MTSLFPGGLGDHLPGVEVHSVHDTNWTGLKNGDLLRAAEQDYDVFVTADQNLQYQQHLAGFSIRVVVLAAKTNRLQDLLPLVPALLEQARQLAEGEVAVVRAGQD